MATDILCIKHRLLLFYSIMLDLIERSVGADQALRKATLKLEGLAMNDPIIDSRAEAMDMYFSQLSGTAEGRAELRELANHWPKEDGDAIRKALEKIEKTAARNKARALARKKHQNK